MHRPHSLHAVLPMAVRRSLHPGRWLGFAGQAAFPQPPQTSCSRPAGPHCWQGRIRPSVGCATPWEERKHYLVLPALIWALVELLSRCRATLPIPLRPASPSFCLHPFSTCCIVSSEGVNQRYHDEKPGVQSACSPDCMHQSGQWQTQYKALLVSTAGEKERHPNPKLKLFYTKGRKKKSNYLRLLLHQSSAQHMAIAVGVWAGECMPEPCVAQKAAENWLVFPLSKRDSQHSLFFLSAAS